MDFAALPPEINSGRMYAGPGPASLLAAAAAWDELATEQSFLADAHSSVIANLTGSRWRGPASTTMVDAAAPYTAWLHDTARSAAQAASQVRSVVGAYETAFAAMVPPPPIRANRESLTALVETNFFGQNSPAIAALEAQYEEMWAHCAAVMYGYQGSAAEAARLVPFSQPPQITNSMGRAAQTASSASAPSSGIVPVIAGEPITSYLFQAASGIRFSMSINDEVWRLISLGSRVAGWYGSALRDFVQGIGPFSPIYGIPLPPAASAASAALGQASQVNALSVPAAWAATTAVEISPAAVTLPGAASQVFAGNPAGARFGETLLGTLAGRAVGAAAAARSRSNEPNKVIPRSPAGG